MKRTFDVIVAVTLLCAILPLMGLIALAVWLDDPGPVFFRGQRVGRGGRVFGMLKFRTMIAKPTTAGQITISHDPRVTRVGRVLRAAKLDELPQLVNVVRGEMSLVGPRPEAPVYVAEYTQEQRGVLAVRPGITGLSQIVFRQEEQLLTGDDPEQYYRTIIMPAKLRIDLDYVRTRSFGGDLRILGRTAWALARPGAQPSLEPRVEMDAARREAPVGKRMSHG